VAASGNRKRRKGVFVKVLEVFELRRLLLDLAERLYTFASMDKHHTAHEQYKADSLVLVAKVREYVGGSDERRRTR